MESIGFFALQWLKTIVTGKIYVVDVFDEKLKQVIQRYDCHTEKQHVSTNRRIPGVYISGIFAEYGLL